MANLFNFRKWIWFGALLAAIISSLLPFIVSKLTTVFPNYSESFQQIHSLRYIILITTGLVFVLSFKWVWRLFWRIPVLGKYLSKKIFPDLNGNWEMTIYSNWPIIETARTASKNTTETFDVQNEETIIPSLSEHKFIATIKQNWNAVSIEIDSTEAGALNRSVTICCNLVGKTGHLRQRLAYVFEQENNEMAPTDERTFPGAAILNITNDPNRLEGFYWTNRSWMKGLNTGGQVVFERQS